MNNEDYQEFHNYYLNRDFENAGRVMYEIMTLVYHSEMRLNPVLIPRFVNLLSSLYEEGIAFEDEPSFYKILVECYNLVKHDPNANLRDISKRN